MNVEIIRVEQSDLLTIGVLLINRKVQCITLERPYLENKDDISCIPAGEYLCKKVISPHFGKTYQVIDVPDRDNILFHSGNFVTDTKGCIIVSRYVHRFNDGSRGVMSSRDAFSDFMLELKDVEEFSLEIR